MTNDDFARRAFIDQTNINYTVMRGYLNNEVVAYWLLECGKKSEDRTPAPSYSHRNVYIDDDFRLRHRTPRQTTGTELARFMGDRYSGFILLNGDGLNTAVETQMQTDVRDQATFVFGNEGRIILPFAALTAAMIDYSTIRPIHITEDRDDTILYPTQTPPITETFVDVEAANDALTEAGFMLASGYGAGDHALYGFGVTDAYGEGDRAGCIIRYGFHYRASLRTRSVPGNEWYIQWSVRARDFNGTGADNWRMMVQIGDPHAIINFDIGGTDNPWPTHLLEGTWTFMATEHRLGASVFSSRLQGRKAKRDVWVSAFDQNEPDPLYFLAQCPTTDEDGNAFKIQTYDEAINSLMPEFVKTALQDGRDVDRQGDIFAVQTTLTDEQVYSQAVTRVRRDIALQDSTYSTLLLPDEGEVVEEAPCPCSGCEGTRLIGCGEAARRALLIYGTTHTANEVVTFADGRTFAKGRLFHDPQLEDPERRPEHQVRTLRHSDAWYLAVRNAVPRQAPIRRRRAREQSVLGGDRLVNVLVPETTGRAAA